MSNLHAVVLISRKMFGDAERTKHVEIGFHLHPNQICEYGIGRKT